MKMHPNRCILLDHISAVPDDPDKLSLRAAHCSEHSSSCSRIFLHRNKVSSSCSTRPACNQLKKIASKVILHQKCFTSFLFPPGQYPVLQSLLSLRFPQGIPFCVGCCVTFLLLVWNPSPQVSEQGLQLLHRPISQSTEVMIYHHIVRQELFALPSIKTAGPSC